MIVPIRALGPYCLLTLALLFIHSANATPGNRPMSGFGRRSSVAAPSLPKPQEPVPAVTDARKKRCDDNSCDEEGGGGDVPVGSAGGGGGAVPGTLGGFAPAGITCSCTCDGLPLDDDPGSGAGGRHLGFANPWAQNPYRPPEGQPPAPPPSPPWVNDDPEPP